MSRRLGVIDDHLAPDGFEVVVLGSAGTYPGAGRLCSGYLFRTPETRLVVDVGYGSTSNLYRAHQPEEIDAIILSHGHADHCVDLVGLYYALRFHADGPQTVDVYAPAGVGERLAHLVSSDPEPGFLEICRFHDVEAGDRLEIGDLAVDLFHSVHVMPTVSVRVTHDGATATYSGDSAGGPDLVAAARRADLFVCEASWVGSAEDYDEGVHLTAGQAGEVAREAGAGRLLLTHIWPRNDLDQARAEAEETYGGAVEIAEDRDVWAVGAS